jgi:hypothetical protein
VTQPIVRTVEFGGFPAEPWMRVDEWTYHVGQSLEGRYGFAPFVELDERLLRIIVALALARKLDAATGGWVSAEQLAVTAEDMTSPAATRKFLSRMLRGYTPSPEDEVAFTRIPNAYVVQYWPLRKVRTIHANGRSRGPYRLGVPRESITLTPESCLAFLGHSMVQLPDEERALPEAIAHAQALADRCDYLAARATLLKGLLHPAQGSNDKQRYGLVADAYHLLGQYGVQLRFPEEAIRSALRARSLFKMLRHPGGVASTLLTEAHAEGQWGNESAALMATRLARTILDDVTPGYRRIKRAECAGVVGQRYSHVHNFEAAERNLVRAFHLAQDVDDRRQVCLWAVRRAENFLRQGDLGATERALSEAHDWYRRCLIAGMERTVLWHVTASFMVATDHLDEASRWATRAKEFALAHRLDSQLARLAPLIAAIDRGHANDLPV